MNKPTIFFLADYYPFGMEMPGRKFSSEDYRFGYNGMEGDDEISGSGNSYTTDFRMYDSRLGRWHTIDPVTYPWQSSYAAFNNNPIYFADPTGLEGTGGSTVVTTPSGGSATVPSGTTVGGGGQTLSTGNTTLAWSGDCGCYLPPVSGGGVSGGVPGGVPGGVSGTGVNLKTTASFEPGMSFNFINNIASQITNSIYAHFTQNPDITTQQVITAKATTPQNQQTSGSGNASTGGSGILEIGIDIAISTVENMIDVTVFTATFLPASFANGAVYGYKDLTHDYTGRAPWIPQKDRFHPYGFSFKNKFEAENVSYGTENIVSPSDGKRLIQGTTTLILPPFLSPAPLHLNLLYKFGFEPAITYPLNKQK